MNLALNPTNLTAIGAFLAGIGSFMGGFAALYYARKRAKQDAVKDLTEAKQAPPRSTNGG
jgi:hypothetical protein